MSQELYGIPRKIKYFTHDEERALLEEYKAGDIQARNKLLESKYHYIISTIKSFRGYRYSREDILQDAMIGAINGIDAWEPDRGALATCMTIHIRRKVIEKLSEVETPVYVPRLYLHYRKSIRDEMAKDVPDYSRFNSANIALPTKAFPLLMTAFSDYTSIEQITSRRESSSDRISAFADKRVDIEDESIENIDRDKLRADINKAMSWMNERQRDIMRRYFGIGRTRQNFKQISAEIGCTKQNANDVVLRMLHAMRRKNARLERWVTDYA